VSKVRSTGNQNILLTERGTFFGYGRLVVDYGGFPALREHGAPLVFDATHSVQRPGGLGNRSGGDRRLAPYLARAACAVGVEGLFFEVHPDPDRAPSDGPNMVRLEEFEEILMGVLRIRAAL
jgi:2-dehydro-3-deoxyphosphooctonate aldolase (KDO 8-P synthase)